MISPLELYCVCYDRCIHGLATPKVGCSSDSFCFPSNCVVWGAELVIFTLQILDLEHSKSTTYEQVPFQEGVHKSSWLINPTK